MGDTIRYWGTDLALIIRDASRREFHIDGKWREQIEKQLRETNDPQAVLRKAVVDWLTGDGMDEDAEELRAEQERRMESVRRITGG